MGKRRDRQIVKQCYCVLLCRSQLASPFFVSFDSFCICAYRRKPFVIRGYQLACLGLKIGDHCGCAVNICVEDVWRTHVTIDWAHRCLEECVGVRCYLSPFPFTTVQFLVTHSGGACVKNVVCTEDAAYVWCYLPFPLVCVCVSVCSRDGTNKQTIVTVI